MEANEMKSEPCRRRLLVPIAAAAESIASTLTHKEQEALLRCYARVPLVLAIRGRQWMGGCVQRL